MITAETQAQCKRFDVESFSDLYKDAHGIRPRMDLSGYTADELDRLWALTEACLERTLEDQRVQEEAATVAFNNRLEGMVRDFSIDSATALRWMLEADSIDMQEIHAYGWDYACYHWGLSYTMAKTLETIMDGRW